MVWIGGHLGHYLAHLGPHEVDHHGNGQVPCIEYCIVNQGQVKKQVPYPSTLM